MALGVPLNARSLLFATARVVPLNAVTAPCSMRTAMTVTWLTVMVAVPLVKWNRVILAALKKVNVHAMKMTIAF
jgi:hypothetical protein